MDKLKSISTVMILLGFVSFIGGIVLSMKEIMEFGVCIGVVGLIGYAVMFIMSSLSVEGQNSIFD